MAKLPGFMPPCQGSVGIKKAKIRLITELRDLRFKDIAKLLSDGEDVIPSL
jgi:hypothetical protein